MMVSQRQDRGFASDLELMTFGIFAGIVARAIWGGGNFGQIYSFFELKERYFCYLYIA